MSQVDHVEMRFSSGNEAPELQDYRPISPLVILACIAGLLSLLAVVHPLLWFVPAVAVVLSACAIRQVSAAHSRYSGRLAAVAALCLAALVGTYAPARAISLERELYARAQPYVKEWISLIQQGRYEEAHQFTLALSERFQGPGALEAYYHPPAQGGQHDPSSTDLVPADPPTTDPAMLQLDAAPDDQLAKFLQEPLIVKLIDYGPQASLTHVQNVSIRNAFGNVEVTQRFRVSGVHEGLPGSIEFLVTSIRWEVLGHANWQFRNFREVQ